MTTMCNPFWVGLDSEHFSLTGYPLHIMWAKLPACCAADWAWTIRTSFSFFELGSEGITAFISSL